MNLSFTNSSFKLAPQSIVFRMHFPMEVRNPYCGTSAIKIWYMFLSRSKSSIWRNMGRILPSFKIFICVHRDLVEVLYELVHVVVVERVSAISKGQRPSIPNALRSSYPKNPQPVTTLSHLPPQYSTATWSPKNHSVNLYRAIGWVWQASNSLKSQKNGQSLSKESTKLFISEVLIKIKI